MAAEHDQTGTTGRTGHAPGCAAREAAPLAVPGAAGIPRPPAVPPEILPDVAADELPVMAWRSDAAGGRDYLNRAWLAFTGRGLAEELGQGWAEGLHPEDRAACLQAEAEARAAARPFTLDYRLRRADGEWRWLRAEARPRIAAGRCEGHLGTCSDITALRLAEQGRARAEADGAELRAELRHRVKNTIQATISYLALQARRTRQEGVAEALHGAATRVLLASQVQDRRFQGGEQGGVALLAELETTARAAMDAAGRPGIAFAMEPGAAGLRVPAAQATSLALLLNELMVNALRHGFPGGRTGRIRLAVRRLPEGRAELRLEDDGVGLPEGVRTHLPRHCLGLHLASRLARQARGRLHLEGPPGTAAVVVFATG